MNVFQPGPDAEIKARILAIEANIECMRGYGLRALGALSERVAQLEAAAAKTPLSFEDMVE